MGFDVFDSGILLSEPYLTMFYNINLLILMHSAKVLARGPEVADRSSSDARFLCLGVWGQRD